MVQKILLNTLLDTMMMTLLVHYAWSFHKCGNTIKVLWKYYQIWKRIEKLLKIRFDSEPVYGDNDEYIKTKIKMYDGSINTNFQGKVYQKKKHYASFYQ